MTKLINPDYDFFVSLSDLCHKRFIVINFEYQYLVFSSFFFHLISMKRNGYKKKFRLDFNVHYMTTYM